MIKSFHSMVIREKDVGSKSYQSFDPFKGVSCSSLHQRRSSFVVAGIDVTSEADETFHKVKTLDFTRYHQRVFSLHVPVRDINRNLQGKISCQRVFILDGDHRRVESLLLFLRVHVASCCKKTINNIDLPLLTGPHQGRLTLAIDGFFVC